MMQRKPINQYIEELIDKNYFNADFECLENIKLEAVEEKYLKNTEEHLLIKLKREFEKTQTIKKCIENPQKAQSFHQFFIYYLEWQELGIKKLSKFLSLNIKDLQFFNDIKNKIVDYPIDVLIKLAKHMNISVNDTIELVRGSYSLAQMKPIYGAALARYHENESTDKGISIKKSLNELLLKSKKADEIQTEEIDLYIDNLKRKFNE